MIRERGGTYTGRRRCTKCDYVRLRGLAHVEFVVKMQRPSSTRGRNSRAAFENLVRNVAPRPFDLLSRYRIPSAIPLIHREIRDPSKGGWHRAARFIPPTSLHLTGHGMVVPGFRIQHVRRLYDFNS